MKIFILVLLFLCSSLTFSAEKVIETIKIFTIDVTPFGMHRDKKPTGLYYEFANKIVETAGYKAQNNIVPFARAHDGAVAGSIDFTIMFDTEELLKNAIQSEGLIEFENLVIPKKGRKIKSFSDLDGIKIGVIRSGCYDIKSRKEIKPKLVEFNDYYQGIKLFESGRIDAICGSRIPMHYSAREMRVPASFFSNAFVASSRKVNVHFSKRLPLEVRNKLNEAILKLKKEKYFDTLTKKFENPHLVLP